MLWTVTVWLAVCLTPWSARQSDTPSPTVESLYERASDWQEFLARVRVHRDLWQRNADHTKVEPVLVDRLTQAARGLRLLIVAEDWCTDSANTIPFVARLAARAHVDLRILDRTIGAPLMGRHPSQDGRGVTPLVVFVRGGEDAGAWVERPRPLQDAFRHMAIDPDSRQRFEARQAWYDADQGRSALEEIVEIAERTAGSR